MIEILLITAILLMAKKPRKAYRYTGYFFPRVTSTLALGTLADNSLIKGSPLGTVDAPTWVSKARLTWGMEGLVAGQTPVMVGLAHSDYTAAEIEEWFEATGSWSTNDQIAQEQAGRKIRLVGGFGDVDSTTLNLNDGKPITTKLGFRINDGDGIVFWIYNDSGAVMTTGSSVHINGQFTCRKM